MKTITTNTLFFAGIVVLTWACGNIALANLGKGDYRPSASEIIAQCEQIHNNNAQLDKCLSAAAKARK